MSRGKHTKLNLTCLFLSVARSRCLCTRDHFRRKTGPMILHTRKQRRHRCKNRLLDSMGEGEGGVICENSIETRALPYVKQMTSASDAWNRTPKACALGQPRGIGWREVGEGFRIGRTHIYLWPIHADVWQKPSQYCNYPPIKIH